MENTENANLYFGGMLVFLGVAVILILMFLKELKAPLMYAQWRINSKNQTQIEVDIIESKIVEMSFHVHGSGQNRASITISLYCPIVVCSFEFNNDKYLLDVNLYQRGYRSPEDAIKELYKVTNGGSFSFIHTFSNTIDSDFTNYLMNFRIKNNATSNKLKLTINSKNPAENEYLYKGCKLTAFIAPGILLLFVISVLFTPLVFFKPLTISTRMYYTIATVLISLLLNYYALPYLKKGILFLLNGDTTEITAKNLIQVKIDNNYDGTQLEKYFSKD